MDISVFRIDDRLTRGQIITAWIAYADVKTIIMADDETTKDRFQQFLLKMAAPDSITLKTLSVDDATAYTQLGGGSGKVLLLMRGPERTLKFIEAEIEKDQINVGNMNMKKGKTKAFGNLWVSPEDIEAIKGIYGHGVRLEVWAIPNERSQDVTELLKKCKLV